MNATSQNNKRKRLLRQLASFVTQHAMDFPPLERADLFEGVSLILTGDDSEQYKYAAAAIRSAESAQLELFKRTSTHATS